MTTASESDPTGRDQHAPGAKLDAGKVQASLLLDMSRALNAVAQVATYGAAKYSRGGWQHVPEGRRRYMDALLRHLFKAQTEAVDADTGYSHEQHAAWNLLALLELKLREEEQAKRTGYSVVTSVDGVTPPPLPVIRGDGSTTVCASDFRVGG